jgi:hypothetical protein
MRRLPLQVLLCLFLSLPALAQGVWGARGASRAFALRGSTLYAADGRGVSVYDVRSGVTRIDVESGDDETYDVALLGTDSLVLATRTGVERFSVAADGTLDRLSWTAAPGPVTEIAANARYAAAASGEIVTIYETEGDELTIARRITLSERITSLAFVGDHLYVSAVGQPLRVYLPPAAAVVELLAGVEALDMAVANGVLWAASEDDGLVALDVANPASPRVLSITGQNELRFSSVAAAGSRVFAFEHPDTLHVYDASKPAAPVTLGTRTEHASALVASESRVFVAGSVFEDSALEYDPGYSPRETGKPVRALDATTLALVAELNDLAGPVSGVWTDGSVAYVVDPPYLRTLDVSITGAPREVSALLVPNLQDHIRVKNGMAVVYGRAYVNFLDVSIPLRPRHVGTWDTQGFPPSSAAMLRDRAIEANEHSGLHVIDISDPARPVQVGGRKWHYVDIAATDDSAYALQAQIMVVVEIANQTTVVDRGYVGVIHDQVDTVPPNSAQPPLLLSRGQEGLRLYSIAGEERFAPRELEFFPMTGLDRFGTGASDAYIAKDGRLHHIDLSQNLALHPTDWRVTSPMQISVAGSKVVVADRYSVRVYGPDTAPPPALPAKRRSARN